MLFLLCFGVLRLCILGGGVKLVVALGCGVMGRTTGPAYCLLSVCDTFAHRMRIRRSRNLAGHVLGKTC